jgi:uncharacterized protein YjbJ (UPF0337 family)
MNKDERDGKLENLKGRAKEAAGALTGNKGRQAEGAAERVEGAAREKIGKVKGDIKRKLDESEDREDSDESKADE